MSGRYFGAPASSSEGHGGDDGAQHHYSTQERHEYDYGGERYSAHRSGGFEGGGEERRPSADQHYSATAHLEAKYGYGDGGKDQRGGSYYESQQRRSSNYGDSSHDQRSSSNQSSQDDQRYSYYGAQSKAQPSHQSADEQYSYYGHSAPSTAAAPREEYYPPRRPSAITTSTTTGKRKWQEAQDEEAPPGMNLMIRNVTFGATQDELHAFIVRHVGGGRLQDVYIPVHADSGLPRNFAFIECSTMEQATAARQMDGCLFKGRTLTVRFAQERRNKERVDIGSGAAGDAASFGGFVREPEEGPVGPSIMVRHVSLGVTVEDLREIFGRVGRILNVSIPLDRSSGKPKEFAFIDYETVEAAKKARSDLDQFFLGGRPLRVRFSRAHRGSTAEEMALARRTEHSSSVYGLSQQCGSGIWQQQQEGGQGVFGVPQQGSVATSSSFERAQSRMHPGAARVGDASSKGTKSVDDGIAPNSSLLLQGLEADITKADLRAVFGQVVPGALVDIHIPRDYHTKKPRDFAYVKYETVEAATKVRGELDRCHVKGHQVRVGFASTRRKSRDEMARENKSEVASSQGGGSTFEESLRPAAVSSSFGGIESTGYQQIGQAARDAVPGCVLDNEDGPEGPNLLVRNLSTHITTEDLRSAFGRVGAIHSVYMPVDRFTRQPKGFAFVDCESVEVAKQARSDMDRFVVKGQALRVRFSRSHRSKTADEMERERLARQCGYQATPSASVGGAYDNEEEGTPVSRLMVGNLAMDTTLDDLRDFFGRLGQLKDVYLPHDNRTNLPRGYGFVEYESLDVAKEARLEMDRYPLHCREMRVRFSRGESEPSPSTKLVASNLSSDITTEDLRKVFGRVGVLRDVYIPHSDNPRKVGFLDFESLDVAKQARTEVDGYVIKGCELQVRFSRRGSVDSSPAGEPSSSTAYAPSRNQPGPTPSLLEGTGLDADDGPPSVSVMVENLSDDIMVEDLTKVFGRVGTIVDVYIPRFYDTKRRRDFAFVRYETVEVASEARVEMDQYVVKGRALKVRFSQSHRKTENEMERLRIAKLSAAPQAVGEKESAKSAPGMPHLSGGYPTEANGQGSSPPSSAGDLAPTQPSGRGENVARQGNDQDLSDIEKLLAERAALDRQIEHERLLAERAALDRQIEQFQIGDQPVQNEAAGSSQERSVLQHGVLNDNQRGLTTSSKGLDEDVVASDTSGHRRSVPNDGFDTANETTLTQGNSLAMLRPAKVTPETPPKSIVTVATNKDEAPTNPVELPDFGATRSSNGRVTKPDHAGSKSAFAPQAADEDAGNESHGRPGDSDRVNGLEPPRKLQRSLTTNTETGDSKAEKSAERSKPKTKTVGDPMDALSEMNQEFLSSVEISTAYDFLGRRPSELGGKYDRWRQAKGKAPLKEGRAGSTISGWQTLVRKRVAELNGEEFVPASTGGGRSRRQKLTDNAMDILPPTVTRFLSSVGIGTADQLASCCNGDVALSFVRWRQEEGMGALKGDGARVTISQWKKKVRDRMGAISGARVAASTAEASLLQGEESSDDEMLADLAPPPPTKKIRKSPVGESETSESVPQDAANEDRTVSQVEKKASVSVQHGMEGIQDPQQQQGRAVLAVQNGDRTQEDRNNQGDDYSDDGEQRKNRGGFV